MDPLDAHPDDLCPPPAYAEQDFDSKVLQATELSLQHEKWEESKPDIDADGWPRYDPAMFEEPRRLSSPPAPATSSSVGWRALPNPHPTTFTGIDIGPLKITKKMQQRPADDTRDEEAAATASSSNPSEEAPWTPTLEPLELPASSPADPTPSPGRPRTYSTHPSYVPRVSFNPNVAYGSSPAISQNRLPPQKPQPLTQYNPHALYNSAVSSQLAPSRTTVDSSSHLSSYQSQFWPNQPPSRSSQPWMRPNDRPTSTYGPKTDTSYADGGVAPNFDQYSHYSSNNFHSMPNDRYLNR